MVVELQKASALSTQKQNSRYAFHPVTMTTKSTSFGHLPSQLSPRGIMLTVVLVVMAVDSGVSQDQPENDYNMVMSAQLHVDVQRSQSQRLQAEEPGDKPVQLDHLLEEASHQSHLLSRENDYVGCAAGTYLVELDLCLTPEQLAQLEPVVSQNTVPDAMLKSAENGKLSRQKRQLAFAYYLTAERDKQLVLSAMAEWERVTCIRFRPARPDDRDLVIFRDGHRCSTNIGQVGGHQLMTLAQPCRTKRILIHELGHVLGLIHEHQRQDRDNYVTVMLQNVRSSTQERYQFSKLAPSSTADGHVEYSYNSIMHYGKNYFAKSPELTTLLTVDPKFQDIIGRADLPALSDAEAVNLMYGCGGSTQNRLSDATCEMFKRTGECEGFNKETIRPLCLRSCLQEPMSYGVQPFRATAEQGANILKANTPLLGQNIVGQSSNMQPSRATVPLKQEAPVFGNIPHSQRSSPQQQLHQQLLQRQRSAADELSKWMPSVTKARTETLPMGPTSVIQFPMTVNPNQMSDWMRSQSQIHTSQLHKALEESLQKTIVVEGELGSEHGRARGVSMADHNMNALSPESLPEAIARPPAPETGGAFTYQQAHVQYSYNTPQHMGLLQSMLSHTQALPSEPPQIGTHVRRPAHEPHLQQPASPDPAFSVYAPDLSAPVHSSPHLDPLGTGYIDSWRAHGFSGFTQNLPNFPAHSPDRRFVNTGQMRRENGMGGQLQVLSGSRSSVPVMHPLVSVGPDSQSYFA